MPRPAYTPPPNDPPSLGSPDFAADASGYLGWFPSFGAYVEAVVDYMESDWLTELPNGTANLPAMRFASDGNTGIFRPGADQIGFATNGVQRVLLSTSAMRVDLPITGAAVQTDTLDSTTGKLLKTGAFGLGGKGANLAASLNLDPSGFYKAGSGLTDGPPGGISNGAVVISGQGDGDSWSKLLIDGNAPGTSPKAWLLTKRDGTLRSWVQFWHSQNIIAAVSQAGGIPTGGLIERGSNANGSYVRLADGTQICWHIIDETAQDWATADGALYRRASAFTWTYPASFSSAPSVDCNAQHGTDRVVGCRPRSLPGASSVQLMPWTSLNIATGSSKFVLATAFGRWF